MAIFVMGDLHLSLSGNKAMDIFPGWENYVEQIRNHWETLVKPEDTVVLAGDTSWGMSCEEALADFQWLETLPGRKLLLKGNHDYWWTTRSKIERFWAAHGLTSFALLHNNSIECEDLILCGSRGWIFDDSAPADAKVIAREAMRLEASLQYPQPSGKEKVAFLHYPPVFGRETAPQILEVLQRYGVRRCYYGHIHGSGAAHAYNGVFEGIEYRLISADFIHFVPFRVD